MRIGNYIKSMYYTEIRRLESKWQVWFSKTIFPDPFGEPKLFVPHTLIHTRHVLSRYYHLHMDKDQRRTWSFKSN